MPDREFRVQILDTVTQWNSGLGFRLNIGADGLSMFKTPSFEMWLDGPGAGGDIVTDECGQTWSFALNAASNHWTLYRNDPRRKETERVIELTDSNIVPHKLWLTHDYLLVFDKPNGRLLGFSRRNYQIVLEIPVKKDELIDIDFDRASAFLALVCRGKDFLLCGLPIPPALASQPACRPLKNAVRPVAMAVSPKGWIYVLDAGLGRFLRLRPGESEPEPLAELSEATLKVFQPSALEIDSRGVLFLASSRPATLLQFDADGSRIGETNLPAGVDTISGIGFDERGGVYIATNKGLARFTLDIAPVGESGLYYARALDNGEPEGLWHRFEFRGSLPPNTNVEVFSYASGEPSLKTAHDRVLASNSSVEDKHNKLENLLRTLWKKTEVFRGPVARDEGAFQPSDSVYDMLFSQNKGQFLYLKLALTSFDEKSRPAVRSARIVYPRISYLRYLPPVYREDPLGAAFLDRFLSLFETIFQGIEEEITSLFRYFDPRIAPPEFLPWIASWINLAIDEDLPRARIQGLIRRAPDLFARKGTPVALTEFLKIYTGGSVLLTEHSRTIKPLVFGNEIRLGFGFMLISAGRSLFRLGDTSVLGRAILRQKEPAPEEAFLPFVRRFSILVNMDPAEFADRAPTLRRIVDEQKPAHTVCALGVISSQNGFGRAQLGVNTTVTELQPYRVGLSSLGDTVAIAKGPSAPRMNRGARFGGKERI